MTVFIYNCIFVHKYLVDMYTNLSLYMYVWLGKYMFKCESVHVYVVYIDVCICDDLCVYMFMCVY